MQEGIPNVAQISFAVLPFAGKVYLCSVSQDEIKPLRSLSISTEYRSLFFESGATLGVMDQGGKSFAAWRLLDDEPWLEARLPTSSLPRRCWGHSFVGYQGRLYVGGGSRSAESLWILGKEDGWKAVALPSSMTVRGKAIDGVFILENRLICIDDIVVPKYAIVLDLEDFDSPTITSVIDLPSHTTYERVLSSAMGEEGIAILSRGINHGTSSAHLSLLGARSLETLVTWSSRGERFQEVKEEGIETPPLLVAKHICLAQGRIYVACGKRGVLEYGPSRRNPAYRERIGKLVSIESIALSSDGVTVFALGYDPVGEYSWERIGPPVTLPDDSGSSEIGDLDDDFYITSAFSPGNRSARRTGSL